MTTSCRRGSSGTVEVGGVAVCDVEDIAIERGSFT